MGGGIGAERGHVGVLRWNARDGEKIVRRQRKPRFHWLADVERVIADLQIVERARAHESIALAIAEAYEHRLDRARARFVRALQRNPRLRGHARPFAHGEVEPRAEDLLMDPAAEDVAGPLV